MNIHMAREGQLPPAIIRQFRLVVNEDLRKSIDDKSGRVLYN